MHFSWFVLGLVVPIVIQGARDESEASDEYDDIDYGSDEECTGTPTAVPNSKVHCTSFAGCRMNCKRKHLFPSGEKTVYFQCSNGTWTLGNVNLQEYTHCKPICRPPCGAGGNCVRPNYCECLPGYQGKTCDLPVCMEECENGGTCTAPDTCECEPGYEGKYCQLNQTQELSFPAEGKPERCCGSVIPEDRVIAVPTGNFSRSEVPGSVKVDQISPEFSETFEIECDPPCQNGGKCRAPGHCVCPRGFGRDRCQVQRCTYPRTGLLHSSIGGTLSRLMIKCHSGYRMSSNDTEMLLLCPRARWMTADLTRVFTTQLAQCFPICQEECQNGGRCIAPDACECLPNFSGKTCTIRKI